MGNEPGPAQRLQPANVGANEGLGIAADTVDGGSGPLQMLGRAIDASFTGYGGAVVPALRNPTRDLPRTRRLQN
jgi:hypothetical protein